VSRVGAATAILDYRDLGPVATHGHQDRLGDFWVPNGGIFVFGETRFETFDSRIHSGTTSGVGGAAAEAEAEEGPGARQRTA
jgi:hypothetical protein